MKKIISMVLVFAMIFCMAACGEKYVNVTLPASFFDGKDEEQIKKDAEANEVAECTVNEDGTVTYKITEERQQEMLTEFEKTFDKTVEETLKGTEESPSAFAAITHNDDFSQIDMKANDKYTALDGLTAMGMLMMGSYYQVFNGIPVDETNVNVVISDEKTGKEIESITSQDLRDIAEEESDGEGEEKAEEE